MSTKYYLAVRPQINENHSVHKEGCPFLPDDKKRIYLGEFSSGKDAVREGQRHFISTKGCIFCSKEQKVYEENPSQFKWADDMIPAEPKGPVSYLQSLIYCIN
jgi:hypothetical protein